MKAKRLITEPLRWGAMRALAPVERRCLRAADPSGLRAVFIVGPPRSGTSLLYELLVTRFGFSYFSNLAHRLPRTPAAATRLGARWIRRWRGRFESDYGHIAGWGAPNEGGWIWRRWLPEEHWLGADAADRLPAETMRRTAASIAETLGGPLLNKNVMHSAHMLVLDRVFPGCLFIETERALADVARSMLKARDEAGDPAAWLSVKPRGWEAFRDANPVEQVCAQTLLTHREIAIDAAALGGDRLLRVRYADLCAAPNEELDRIKSFLAGHGVEASDRGDRFKAFERRSKPWDEAMRAAFDRGMAEARARVAAMDAPAAHEATTA